MCLLAQQIYVLFPSFWNCLVQRSDVHLIPDSNQRSQDLLIQNKGANNLTFKFNSQNLIPDTLQPASLGRFKGRLKRHNICTGGNVRWVHNCCRETLRKDNCWETWRRKGTTIKRYILDKWDEMLSGFSWLIMKLNRWLLRAWWRTSGFHKTMYFFIGCVLSILNFFLWFILWLRHYTASNVWRWMNNRTGRDFEGRGRSRTQAWMEGLRTIRKASIPGNVRATHLPNITREQYQDSNLLGPFASQDTLHHEIGVSDWYK
jgi:hypothetical protein